MLHMIFPDPEKQMRTPFVEFILVAEFDIDKGSSLTHQYPTETGTEPS